MESMSIPKKVLIVLSAIIYVVHLVLNALSAAGKPDNALFPNTVGNVSRHFEIPITPVSATFAIWSAIFIFQIIWFIYSCVNIFRSGPVANILSSYFYITFNVNIAFISAWLFTWSRKQGVTSFVIIVLGQIFFDIAIGCAFYSLKKFLDNNPKYAMGNKDVWFQRIIVQNGLLFYGTWTTVATNLNFCITLVYYLDVAVQTACIVTLVIVGVILLSWFIFENFVFVNSVQYTITAYVVLIIALNGVFANGIFDTDKTVGGLVLALLITAALFLIIRLIIIVVRHVKNNTGGKFLISS